jgi:hypothetical protein
MTSLINGPDIAYIHAQNVAFGFFCGKDGADVMSHFMETVTHAVTIGVPASEAWAAISDVGQLLVRVAPGLVMDMRLEDGGDVRIVTFATNAVPKKHIISNDPDTMRLAWTASDGPRTHHKTSLKTRADGAGCTATWMADVLPQAAAAGVAQFVELGLATFTTHMEPAS